MIETECASWARVMEHHLADEHVRSWLPATYSYCSMKLASLADENSGKRRREYHTAMRKGVCQKYENLANSLLNLHSNTRKLHPPLRRLCIVSAKYERHVKVDGDIRLSHRAALFYAVQCNIPRLQYAEQTRD